MLHYKIPLIIAPQPEGGFTVTSPLLLELLAEGDTYEESLHNVKDALDAVVETYQQFGRQLPQNALITDVNSPVWLETVVGAT